MTIAPETVAIRTRGLTKAYGKRVALSDLDLDVPRGIVFGYLGPNGAGTSTTIRVLMGLMRPTAGGAEIGGYDIVSERERVHSIVGYLPGDFVAYNDLTGEQYLRFLSSLRGGVDWSFVELLAKRFELDIDRRIGELSHGNRQKVGLVQAFMHRPEVLILDEPTSGLDPLIQQEFLALVRETRNDGRTVFLSSHILDEVEAVADRIGMLRQGRLIVTDTVQNMKSRAVRRIDLYFDDDAPDVLALRKVSGVMDVSVSGKIAHVRVEGSIAELLRLVAPFGVHNLVTHDADLEEIFLSYYEMEVDDAT